MVFVFAYVRVVDGVEFYGGKNRGGGRCVGCWYGGTEGCGGQEGVEGGGRGISAFMIVSVLTHCMFTLGNCWCF